jgi:hypothetical protein
MWQLDVPPNQIAALEGNLFSSGYCLNAWKGHIEAYDGKLNIWNVVNGSRLQTLFSPMHLHIGRHGGKPATVQTSTHELSINLKLYYFSFFIKKNLRFSLYNHTFL